MLDKRLVEEYQKIKPADDLKKRIAYRVEQQKQRQEAREQKPLYAKLKPIFSGVAVCVLLVCCLTVLSPRLFENGDMAVSYARSGEPVAMSSREIRAYEGLSTKYDTISEGLSGAEFTFLCGAKTEAETEFGSIYVKNADGSYESLGKKARIDGEVQLFWELPKGEEGKEVTMTLKNRFGEWTLVLVCNAEEYMADLVEAE